jgi:hypothetical protein
MSWLGLFMLVAAGLGANPGAAIAQGVCADDGGNFPKACTKEIRIYNNTPRQIWVVLQASIQLTDAISCTVKDQGGGDVWLQVALGKTNDCFAVKSDYYAFINPGAGVPSDGFVSIKVPWWSKRKQTAAPDSDTDRYIDWWRGGRVMIFDDRTALNEIYNKLNVNPVVAFVDGSPKPSCNNDMTGNACNGLRIFRVPSGVGIDPHLPFQLNEFTFADVCKVTADGTFEPVCQKANPKGFIDFNQNYNVSNVDQVYLPLAMEPVRDPPDVGYMGTTLSVQQFRKQLTNFTNADNPNNLFWPIYNNPTVNGNKAYPQAGIRVPSAQSVLAFYMNPFVFPDGKTPAIIPKDRPKLVQNMLDMWQDCTADNPQICTKLQSGYYTAVNKVFLDNYKRYVDTCPDNKIPAHLKPVRNNPPEPKPTAFLTFVYGWVPFNVGCGNKELPVVDDPPPDSRSVIDYFQMQYNYQDLFQDLSRRQWFNPYTQLIHDKVGAGGLAASAYAFSIDDHASFLSNGGGSLPGGLIFAVGGPKGLVNGKQHAPPVPPVYKWYDFSIGLGTPGPRGPFWQKYGICSDTADTPFPEEEKGGQVIGVDPALTPVPCPITLQDTNNRKYQLVILRAKTPGDTLPQDPIWPAFEPSGVSHHDPNVVACPAKDGFVPPDQWCNNGVNETSRPAQDPNQPGFYTITTPPPLGN